MSAVSHTALGTSLSQLSQWDAAIAEFESALKLAPDDTAAKAGLEKARQTRALVSPQ